MRAPLVKLLTASMLLCGAAIAAEKPEPFKGWGPTITVIALYNQPGIPKGWEDSTTRPEATDICNALIANQSKLYENAISKSRCIIQVQK